MRGTRTSRSGATALGGTNPTAWSYPCVLHRNLFGAWCGYVAVPPGHPWHGKDYDDVYAEVHGGLTYADECDKCVCHVPAPGEPDDVWWLGFDCGHFNDLMPGHEAEMNRLIPDRQPWNENFAVYRTAEYVKEECENLALQAYHVCETQP